MSEQDKTPRAVRGIVATKESNPVKQSLQSKVGAFFGGIAGTNLPNGIAHGVETGYKGTADIDLGDTTEEE